MKKIKFEKRLIVEPKVVWELSFLSSWTKSNQGSSYGEFNAETRFDFHNLAMAKPFTVRGFACVHVAHKRRSGLTYFVNENSINSIS